MNRRDHLKLAVAIAAAALVGCGHRNGGTKALPPAAEPQFAPAPTITPSGRVVAVGTYPEGVAVDAATRTVAVATRYPNELVLINIDSGAITARVSLPASARHLKLAAPGGPVLVPMETANALVRVELTRGPRGQASTPIPTGTFPHDAAATSNGTIFVTNEHDGTVSVLRGDKTVKVFPDGVQPAGVAAFGNTVGVVDARKNTLTVYDAEKLTVVGSSPAGAGPTHVVADRRGRMIVTDTRGDTVRVFDPLPTPREIGSAAQPGGPYGIAYDATRERLWVASSGTNEVIGYSLAEQAPQRVARIPSVQNPYSLGVDSVTGRLFIAGVTGGVVQVIDPGATGE
ncbi:PE-PGRS family protein PE_PGRS18 [Mycobacterium simulans]|uniref:PE-PGRS family protein PE_PGRS18 n=1 Tax=Mycobacterium simulans TaxID=627089 RepID=A0A7Z7II73_9MYCO|nr:YncE family protein [Mycobacterium simulans]SOJ53179.1 PE-PGRS family protein PE_PGRS18 [Mycobacterium simulans]